MWQVKDKFMWLIRFAVFRVYEYCLCLYFSNSCSISFFVLFSAKDSLLFIINLISCFKLSSSSLGQWKSKQNVLGSLITIILSSMIILTWFNCCKLFYWFYYAETKDIVSVWFHFLISMNCFQFFFLLIILKV